MSSRTYVSVLNLMLDDLFFCGSEKIKSAEKLSKSSESPQVEETSNISMESLEMV